MKKENKVNKYIYFAFLLTIITITLFSGTNTKYKLEINDEIDGARTSTVKRWIMLDISDINTKLNIDKIPEITKEEDNVLIAVDKNHYDNEENSSKSNNKKDLWNKKL